MTYRNLFSSNQWHVCENYESVDSHLKSSSPGDPQTRWKKILRPTGNVSRSWELGHQLTQDNMLKDWLGNGDLMDWISYYGLPCEMDEFDGPTTEELETKRLRLQVLWRAYKRLQAKPDKPNFDTFLLIDGLVPAAGFVSIADEIAQEHGYDEYQLVPASVPEEELKALGKRNFRDILDGVNPFPAQGVRIKQDYAEARDEYPKARWFSWTDDDKTEPVGNWTPRVMLHIGRLADGVKFEADVDELIVSPVEALTEGIKQCLAEEVNATLSGIQPRVALVCGSFQQEWSVRNPLQAMCLSMLRRLTLSDLWAVCEVCGTSYEKTRSDKLTCSETCSRQRLRLKKKGGR